MFFGVTFVENLNQRYPKNTWILSKKEDIGINIRYGVSYDNSESEFDHYGIETNFKKCLKLYNSWGNFPRFLQ